MAYTKAELAAEFWMLTKGILQDGTVDTSEAKVLKHWLEEHQTGDEYKMLIDRLSVFLADGFIAPYESKRLLDSFGTILAQLNRAQ